MKKVDKSKAINAIKRMVKRDLAYIREVAEDHFEKKLSKKQLIEVIKKSI